MRSPVARSVSALALLGVLVVLLAIGAAGGAAQDDQPAETLAVELQPDGDARWTVTFRFELDSQNETEAFDRMAAEFENGESDVMSVDPYRKAANRSEHSTGREMEIRDVARQSSRSNAMGRLELSFTWTAFADEDGERLLLGDVFHTESGTWLPGLHEDQELVIVFPDSFSVVDSSHNLENRAFEIRGPTTFDDDDLPSATLVRGRTTVTTTSPGTATNATTNTTTPGDSGAGTLQAVGIGTLALLVGALALLVERRRRSGRGPVLDENGDDGRPGVAGIGDGDETASEHASASSATGVIDEPEDSTPEPLLSDDERVLRLLHRNDGRMKQARIVEETDWSNAKVSQLLSEMAERDEIDKLRIGRENLISLPGEGPETEE